MSRLTEAKRNLKDGFNRSINRKPAYFLTEDGISVEYFNFENKKRLPFDTETYEESQVFLGKWANAWDLDIDLDELPEGKETVPVEVMVRLVEKQLHERYPEGGIEIDKPVPLRIDLDAIPEIYDEYEYPDPVTDLVQKEHIKPAQSYKTYMNQYVLSSTFSFGGLDFERMKYLLYAIAGLGVINLMVMLT